MKTARALLGGLTPNIFLRDYWQKKPLLIRAAVPGFNGLLDAGALMALACDDAAQARLVVRHPKKWRVTHGPFAAQDFARLPKKNWTLLLQEANHFLPAARDLLRLFDFIPHARLDDLMVSYAVPGGGVGAHFDSYDVFLLQGAGERRWQISAQQDQNFVAGAPLKILRDFRPEQEWVLGAGDMLYLPPGYAHHGVAENACMTYSIGFRAPGHAELAREFLVHLQDRIDENLFPGLYQDPGLRLQPHPADLSDDMVQQVDTLLHKIKWDRAEVARFLGCYLTEPKPHVFFSPPARGMSFARFQTALNKYGATLDLKSRMLCTRKTIFLNGDAYRVGGGAFRLLRTLADQGTLPAGAAVDPEAAALLYEWRGYGYIEPKKRS